MYSWLPGGRQGATIFRGRRFLNHRRNRPIHSHHCPRNVARAIRREVDHCVGDFAGFGDSAQRAGGFGSGQGFFHADALLPRFGLHAFVQARGEREAGVDGVHARPVCVSRGDHPRLTRTRSARY